MSYKHHLFLDLDGLLCAFVEGAMKLHNKFLPMKDVRWNFETQLGIDRKVFWDAFGFDFWSNLEWTKEGKELLAALESIFGPENITIMTSPCLTRGGIDGKIDWIRREIPAYSRRYFVGPEKHPCAGPGKFLLDDRDENVKEFGNAGGCGILVPRPWNASRELTDEEGRFDVAEMVIVVKSVVR